MTYHTLIAATKILDNAMLTLMREEGSSPAWTMIYHAQQSLMKQAKLALRGE